MRTNFKILQNRSCMLCKSGIMALLILAIVGLSPVRSAAEKTTQPHTTDRLGAVSFADIAGKNYTSQDIMGNRATVFLFVSCQCPISNIYTSRFQALKNEFAGQGVAVFAVYSDNQESKADVIRHVKEHALTLPAVKDDRNRLADRLGATYTPQAVLVNSAGVVCYRGRIDDNAVITRVTSHDLTDALTAVLAGKPVVHPEMPAFGCAIRRVPTSTVVAKGGYTYAHDVAPILRAKCEGCHRPGEVAPFALQDYKQARAWATDIKRYTQNGQMPPWKPAPGYGAFANEQDHSLNDHEREILAKWTDNGAPLGNPKETPAPRQYAQGWHLGQPDAILSPGKDYHLSADGEDVYRNFVIKTDFPEDRWVSAVEIHPGNRAVVHHVINYVDGMKASTKLDGKDNDGQPGFTSFGGPGFIPTGILGGWAPGNEPQFLPDGVGMRVPKNGNIVIQVHYHKDGKPEIDRTQIGLYFAKTKVDKEARPNFLLNFQIKIPAGADNYRADATEIIPEDSHILNILPHMHLIGREMKVWATLPDGTEKPIVWIKDWDFNWQGTYVLKEPLALPKGSKVHLTAFYDNSNKNLHNPNRTHPQDVSWGEQTTDEMCVAFLTLTKDAEHLAQQTAAAK